MYEYLFINPAYAVPPGDHTFCRSPWQAEDYARIAREVEAALEEAAKEGSPVSRKLWENLVCVCKVVPHS